MLDECAKRILGPSRVPDAFSIRVFTNRWSDDTSVGSALDCFTQVRKKTLRHESVVVEEHHVTDIRLVQQKPDPEITAAGEPQVASRFDHSQPVLWERGRVLLPPAADQLE